jgi:hypothetical protein
MADVKIGSKVFQLDEDADTQQKQRKIYEQYKNSSSEAELEAKLLAVPIPEKKYYVSLEAIEKKYQKCKESHIQAGLTNDEGYCDRWKAEKIKENEIIENLEKTETAKSATPDPVPSEKVVATSTTVTKTETSTSSDGTVKTSISTSNYTDTTTTEGGGSTTIKSSSTPPEPKTTSTPAGTNIPVSNNTANYNAQQASSNNLSKPVDVLNFQEKPKTNQKEVLKKVAEDLIPIESSIKAGGTQHLTYEKDIHISVGSVANTFPHIRKDSSGEFRPKSISIEGKGAFVKHSPVSYTEEVENSRFPCGTYSINAANKLDLTSGAGGTNVTSGGNMKVGSNGRTLITAREEMNVSSGNGNVNVRAAHNVSIKGDSLTLETPNQVVVNANLGVAKNAIINGCAFVDGELYVNHITCPAEVQYTGGGIGAFGQLMTAAGINGDNKGAGGTTVIAYADVSFIKKLLETPLRDSRGDVHRYTWSGPDKVPVLILSDSGTNLASSAGNGGVKSNPEYSIYTYPHSHPFNNVPLTFTDGNESLRSKAAILNSGNIGTAANIEHGYKSIGKTLPGTI